MANLHDLMVKDVKFDNVLVYDLVLMIYSSYVDNRLGGDWSKLSLFDKVNWLLTINRVNEITSKDLKHVERKNNFLESFPEEFEIHKKILIAHLDNDVEKMMLLIPKLLKDHELPKKTIEEWFVFHKFFKKKKFANFVENL